MKSVELNGSKEQEASDEVTAIGGQPGSVRAPAKPGASVARALDPAETLRKPEVWVPIAVLAVAFVAAFWRWLLKQYQPQVPIGWSFLEPLGGYSWQKPEDWGHAYLVPLISLAVLWRDRAAIAARPAAAFWPGVVCAALGIVTYTFFIVGYSNHMFQGAAIVLTLTGLVLLLQGPARFKFMVFPLGYLLFAITISESVMNRITYKLQDIAAQGAWAMLNAMTIDTDIAGNALAIHPSSGGAAIPLNVAAACSGMRMVIAFLALGAALGWLSSRVWWQRIAMILIGLPIAVAMNVVRVTVLGVLSLWNPAIATGSAHMMIGYILLVPTFFLYLGCVWLIKRIQPPSQGPDGGVLA